MKIRKHILAYSLILLAGCTLNSQQNLIRIQIKNLEETPAVYCIRASNQRPEESHLFPLIKHIKMAESGNQTCQKTLGERYENGIGAPIDYLRAQELYSMTSIGKMSLGRMAEYGIGQPVDYHLAEQFYRKAGDEGIMPAGYVALGKLLEKTGGDAVDQHAIMDIYLSATRQRGDTAWTEIQRLRSTGVQLDEDQIKKHNQIYINSLYRTTAAIIRRSRDYANVIRNYSEDFEILVTYTFKNGSGTPEITLTKKSGIQELDKIVNDALQRFQYGEGLAMEKEQQQIEIKYRMILSRGQSDTTSLID